MKHSIIFTTIIALALSGQLVFAGDITDSYAAGDPLTATLMGNIKTAVNDNDNNISVNTLNIGINAGNITTLLNNPVTPWAVTSSDIYYNTGNVGIGIVAPTTKLEINGNVKIPAANDYTYSTAKTRYQTISHAAFEIAIIDTNTAPYRNSPGIPYMVRTIGGTLGVPANFIAPVDLPDGATVTNLDVRVYDADGTYDCSAALIRQTWFGPTIGEMANVDTTGISSGQVSLSTAAITYPLIDKSTYAYFILFTTTEDNRNLGIYNARITYTVTSTD